MKKIQITSKIVDRRGFGLLEIVIGIGILATVTLAMTQFIARYSKTLSLLGDTSDFQGTFVPTIRLALGTGALGTGACSPAPIPTPTPTYNGTGISNFTIYQPGTSTVLAQTNATLGKWTITNMSVDASSGVGAGIYTDFLTKMRVSARSTSGTIKNAEIPMIITTDSSKKIIRCGNRITEDTTVSNQVCDKNTGLCTSTLTQMCNDHPDRNPACYCDLPNFYTVAGVIQPGYPLPDWSSAACLGRPFFRVNWSWSQSSGGSLSSNWESFFLPIGSSVNTPPKVGLPQNTNIYWCEAWTTGWVGWAFTNDRSWNCAFQTNYSTFKNGTVNIELMGQVRGVSTAYAYYWAVQMYLRNFSVP